MRSILAAVSLHDKRDVRSWGEIISWRATGAASNAQMARDGVRSGKALGRFGIATSIEVVMTPVNVSFTGVGERHAPRSPRGDRQMSFAASVISTAFSAFETGQFCFASTAVF